MNLVSFRPGSHCFNLVLSWGRIGSVARERGRGLSFTFPACKMGIMVSALPLPQTFYQDLGWGRENWTKEGRG